MSDWWSDIKGVLGPVLEIGSGVFDEFNRNRTANDLKGAAKGMIDRDFANQKAYNDAVTKYNQDYQAYSASNAAASRAAAAARSAAANATEASRQRAGKRAQRSMDKTFGETMALYKPFADSAASLLPQMQKGYERGLGLFNNLSDRMAAPEQMAKIDSYKPAYMIDIPLPDYLKKKKA